MRMLLTFVSFALLKKCHLHHKISVMKQNIGGADKMIRIFIAIVCSVLFITGVVAGTVGYIVLAVGAILLGTALVNVCPLYKIFGIKTCRR